MTIRPASTIMLIGLQETNTIGYKDFAFFGSLVICVITEYIKVESKQQVILYH